MTDHPTNRYRDPAKRRAYKSALRQAKNLSSAVLWSPVADVGIHIRTRGVNAQDVSQVKAKAVMVERGRRRKKKK